MKVRRGLMARWLCALVVTPAWPAQPGPDEVQAQFAKAAALLQENKPAEALPLLRDLTTQAPEAAGVYWNLGMAATSVGEKQLALDAWLRFRALRPADLQGMSKVVQAYQALGMTRERDAQREQILAWRAALEQVERARITSYVRDQFDAGGLHFVVEEYFEPASPLRHVYRFHAVDAGQKLAYYFALESNESTEKMARQLGNIGPEERLFSLDRFESGGHATYTFLKGQPPYDVVRTMVLDAVEGRLRPVSSSTR